MFFALVQSMQGISHIYDYVIVVFSSFWQAETILALNLLDLDVTPGNIVAVMVEMPIKNLTCNNHHGAKSIYFYKLMYSANHI